MCLASGHTYLVLVAFAEHVRVDTFTAYELKS